MSDMLLIRGGRVVNPQARRADPADVLIAGDTILEIGPPGLAAPDDATGGSPLVAPPFREATVLSVGHAYQSATAWHRRSPDL